MSGNSESVRKGWLKRPRRDHQKRKEYHENYRRSEKGRASLKASKRRYWEKLKADPVRLDLSRAKVREAMRLRRLREPKKERKPRDRKPKPMKPIKVGNPRKIWASQKYRGLFVENGKTVRRGRPRKVKAERPHCDHDQGFVFKMTDVGMRRTCKACGQSFTEVAKR